MNTIASSTQQVDKANRMGDIEIEVCQNPENGLRDAADSVPMDVISVAVRKGTKGVGMVAVLTMTVVMASVSFIGVLSYSYQPLKSDQDGQQVDQCTSGQNLPLWADLLVSQIDVIQNLIHASLVGAALLVAAFRGDVLWFFLVRNVSLYFGLAAYSHLTVDIVVMHKTGLPSDLQSLCRIGMEAVMALAATLAFFRLEVVRQRVISLQHQHYESLSRTAHENSDRIQYPSHLAETRAQRRKTDFLYKMGRGIQLTSVAYAAKTTWSALTFPDCVISSSASSLLDDNVWLFESSYTSGGHQAMCLAFVFLAATFPQCSASQGGAMLTSTWRLLLALAYLPRVIPLGLDQTTLWPLVYACIEIVVMLGVLVTTILQRREIVNSHQAVQKQHKEVQGNKGAYSEVSGDEEVSGMEAPDETLEAARGEVNAHKEQSCWTMRQISQSSRYSRSQRQGACLLWVGSLMLLCEMTMECFVLLTKGVVATVFTDDVYKWGMHVAAMYLFCAIMVASCPEVYERARVLLAVACPAGSLIGLLQLWYLATNLQTWDAMSAVAAFLFGARAVCGVLQTAGLVRLHHIEEVNRESEEPEETTSELEALIARARFTLFHWYLPTLGIYLALAAPWGSCNYPLVSPTVQNNCVSSSSFLLAPSWPGFGTFFHYGILLVVFANDGLQVTPSYRPSLLIAMFFAVHVAVLIAVSIGVEVWRFYLSGHAPWARLAQIVAVCLFMITSGLLSRLMYQVSKLQGKS